MLHSELFQFVIKLETRHKKMKGIPTRSLCGELGGSCYASSPPSAGKTIYVVVEEGGPTIAFREKKDAREYLKDRPEGRKTYTPLY
jgi:hypothetical protein